MTDFTREARFSGAFVLLADTLTDEFDVVDLLPTPLEDAPIFSTLRPRVSGFR
jgi:hypothetical protein